MIALKAINFHVPAHMITVGDFQSDWRKCNPIKKAQRSTGTVKSTAPCQRFFSRLRPSANTENSPRTREKPLVLGRDIYFMEENLLHAVSKLRHV